MLQRDDAHGVALALSIEETLPFVKVTLMPRCPLRVPGVIPFRDCFCTGGGLLTSYRRAYQGGDFLSRHSYL